MASCSVSAPYVLCDVFISLCDYKSGSLDVNTFATKLCSHLESHESHKLQVYLDTSDSGGLLLDDNIPSKMEANILAASVHIAIFPPTYKLSKWRFDELALMIKSSVESRTFVIPVFYDAEVSELRRTGEKALRNYEKKKLYDGQTIKEWRNALSLVTGISGFVVEEGPRGENELLNKLVKSVFYDFGDGPRHQVFINHRGEVKENFARPLYNRLVSSGLKVFLDEPEMVRGLWIASQLEVVIQCTPVTIAVFSPKYAQSSWCLNELLLTVRSGNAIIPVFYGVKRSDLQCPEDGVYAKDLLNYKNKHPYDSETLQNWTEALSEVATRPGYELDGNKEDLLDEIVQRVNHLAKPSVVVESSEVQSVGVSLKSLKSLFMEDVPKQSSEVQSVGESLKSLKSLFMEDVPKQSENFPAGKQFESGEDNGSSDYGFSNRHDGVVARIFVNIVLLTLPFLTHLTFREAVSREPRISTGQKQDPEMSINSFTTCSSEP